MVSGTSLSAKEYQYFLYARYNVDPLNPQSHCGRCGTDFWVTHSLSCSTDGLVIARHNKIREEILYLDRWSFTPAPVRVKPLIHQVHTIS